MRRISLIHPLIWALCPALALYRANIGELSLSALPPPLAISMLCTLLLWGIFARVFRDNPQRAAYLTSFVLLMFFSYGHVYHYTEIFESILPGWRFINFGIWLMMLVAGCWVLARLKVNGQVITDWLFAASLIVFLNLLINITGYEIVRHRAAQHLRHHHQRTVAHINEDKLPNIYYIILDSYPSPQTMSRVFKQENMSFVSALRQRGFYVAEDSRSNYCQTILSLSSSLNYNYLYDLQSTTGVLSNNRQPLEHYVHNNRVCETLRQYGYHIISFPSSYEPVSIECDEVHKQKTGLSDFHKALIDTTPLIMLSLTASNSQFDPYAVHRNQILWQFAHVPDVFSKKGPLFVFVHILAPHQPLVFDAAGNPVKADPYRAIESGTHWRKLQGTREEYNQKFRGELTYLNRRTLELIDDIQRHATRETAIILQGDHGPGFLPDQEPDLATMSIPERFHILNAYCFPNGNTRQLYPTISPVNSFRVLFNAYFGEHNELLRDRSYFSPFLHPYHFLDISDATTYGDGAEMSADAGVRQRIQNYMHPK